MSARETTIVAGVAFSPHAQLIASTAFVLARRLSARVVFIHVGSEDVETRQRLNTVLREAEITGDCELVLRPGNPAEILLDVADELHADLLITGALESEGMLQTLFGSVARKVARRAHCPVLLLPLNVHTVPRLDNVVMGVRSGESVDSMLNFTLKLIRSAGQSKLHIVQESDYALRLAARYVDEREREEFESRQRSSLADALSVYDFSGIHLEVAVLDDTAEGIGLAEYARNNGADLVVTQAPSRALTLRDRIITHPAESVLVNLPCGILLYRSESKSAGKE
ncbi:MAG: universal stress protein [Bacteroidota bacterium]